MTDVIIPADDGGWTLTEAVTGHVDRLLLYGPPGTGKSFHAQKDAHRGFYRVYLTEDTPMFELRGGPTLPEGVWQDGPCIRAWREGKRLILDEIDKAPSEAMSFLLGVLDDPETATLTLPHGENVTPAPGFHCVATTNGSPGDLPDALRDRFTVAIEIDQPHKQAIASLPADLRKAAKASAKAEGNRRVSIRGWACFGELRVVIGHDAAARAVFGSRFQDVLDAFAVAKLVKTPSGAMRPAKPKAAGSSAEKVLGACKYHSDFSTDENVEAYVTLASVEGAPHPSADDAKIVGYPVCDSCMAAIVGEGRITEVRNASGRSVPLKHWDRGGKYHFRTPGYVAQRGSVRL